MEICPFSVHYHIIRGLKKILARGKFVSLTEFVMKLVVIRKQWLIFTCECNERNVIDSSGVNKRFFLLVQLWFEGLRILGLRIQKYRTRQGWE